MYFKVIVKSQPTIDYSNIIYLINIFSGWNIKIVFPALPSSNFKRLMILSGLVRTDIFRNASKWMKIFGFVLKPIGLLVAKDCLEGAQTTIYCAIDESLVTLTFFKFNAKYFHWFPIFLR